MLSHIHIRDFAIIDQVELELSPGMTVLTGETGAGKSILLDALGLALGDRADSGTVRHGCNRAEISVDFDLQGRQEVVQWLEENALDDEEGNCQIRRTISKDGRSKGFINGRPAPIQMLRELGEMLVDIHGQHEHQSLLRRDMQRQLLDDYAGHGKLLTDLEQRYQQWHNLQDELARLRQANSDRDARLELLSYQVQELETLALGEKEMPELEEEHGRLANSNRLLEGCERAVAVLYEGDEGSVESLIGQLLSELETLQGYDPRLGNAVELLNNAKIQVEEAASELRHYLGSLESDPERLTWLEQRLDAAHSLARKHRVEPEELPVLLPQLATELRDLQEADIRLGELEKAIDNAANHYLDLAKKLTASRTKAAKTLSESVSTNMQELGMPGGRFEIQLTSVEEGEFTPYGLERVEFLVSANPGQPLKPLSKVASGGELSRISLAIQVITAQNARIPTLIFDEVDVGIGGGVAEIVGRQLRTLGECRQVMCVTHQPQVAALAHHHLQVSKRTAEGQTHTQLKRLEDKERVEEVARMLGGVEITEQTLSHAQEMIERSRTPTSPARRKA